jgi:hypothetical protein
MAVLVAFDLLELDGCDVRGERRAGSARPRAVKERGTRQDPRDLHRCERKTGIARRLNRRRRSVWRHCYEADQAGSLGPAPAPFGGGEASAISGVSPSGKSLWIKNTAASAPDLMTWFGMHQLRTSGSAGR